MENGKNHLLRILINFKFPTKEDSLLLDSIEFWKAYLNDQNTMEFVNSGWREKLIFSFITAWKKDISQISFLIESLLKEKEGKQIKGYVLALNHLAPEDQVKNVYKTFLAGTKVTNQEAKKWVLAGLNTFDSDYTVEYSKFDQKIKNGLAFLNKYSISPS